MKKFIEYSGYIFGVVSLILTFYFYELSRKEKEPTFVVDPIKTEIINPSLLNHSPIKIVANDTVQITKTLTNIRFYFWNKGKDAIRQNDILKNIIITTDSNSEIIYYRILKTSRDLSAINVSKISKNQLQINFKILEKNDGFTGEIFLEGNSDAKIELNGAVEGVLNFSNFPLPFYRTLGKAIIYTVGVPLLLLVGFSIFYFSSSSPHIEPLLVTAKKDERYKGDDDFKRMVDKLENYQTASWKLVEQVNNKLNPSKTEIKIGNRQKNRRTRKTIIIVGVCLLFIGGIVFAYHQVEKDVSSYPSKYIPSSIRQ